jgi:hypothetical protein
VLWRVPSYAELTASGPQAPALRLAPLHITDDLSKEVIRYESKQQQNPVVAGIGSALHA